MKKGDDLFDFQMGAWNGAEVCEFIGIFYWICLGDNIMQKTWAYIGTMDCQFLKNGNGKD